MLRSRLIKEEQRSCVHLLIYTIGLSRNFVVR